MLTDPSDLNAGMTVLIFHSTNNNQNHRLNEMFVGFLFSGGAIKSVNGVFSEAQKS